MANTNDAMPDACRRAHVPIIWPQQEPVPAPAVFLELDDAPLESSLAAGLALHGVVK